MLLDRYRQLLTAYVDGELSSRQRRHVVRLLHRSAEARQLLQQLKADSRSLRQLPQPSLPADFVGPVLRLIAERSLTPSLHRVVKTVQASAWLRPLGSWAAAAAVLLALGVASYFYFVASLDQPAKTEIALTQSESSVSTPLPQEPEPVLVPDEEDDSPAQPSKPSAPKNDRRTAAKPRKFVRKKDDKSKPRPVEQPAPSVKKEVALAERVETFPLDRVPDILPVIVKISDLVRAPPRKKLIAELHKDNAFRLELPCPNGTKAFDRVQNAARTQHIGLLIDKSAQERIKLKWRISYLLYLEDITPEELAEFVHQIDIEDHKSAAGKPAEVQFDRLVLTRLNAGHRKELAAYMGLDPIATSPNTTISHSPGQSSAGQGGAAKPAAQPSDHLALVLAYSPVRPSPGSDEIKQFLESRKPTRPGTLRVLVVLRNG